MEETQQYFSTSEAAKICQVSPASVIRWVKEGELDTALTVGGHRRIPAASLLRLAKRLGLAVPNELAGVEDPGVSVLKILIVDDDEGIRQLVRWALKEELPQAQLEEAPDGFVAGWKAHRFRPDLVILDIMMPGVDGFRFCELIQGMPEMKRTRILAMSGVQGADYEEKILKFGAHDFLAKPFEIETLKQKVAEQLTHIKKGDAHAAKRH